MTGRKPTDVISKVPALNITIQDNYRDRIVNRETIREIFKKVGLPFNSNIWSILRNNSSILIEQSKKGEYKFISAPIYKGNIKEVYDTYRRGRTTEVKKEVKKEDIASKINKAIIFLINHGYSVWQPGLTYFNK